MRVPPAGTWALRPALTETGTPFRGSQAPGHIVLLLLVITPQWRWIPSKTPNVAPLGNRRCNPGGYLRGGVSPCAPLPPPWQPAALPNLGRLQKKRLRTRCKGRRLCPNAGDRTRGHSARVMFLGVCVCPCVGLGGRSQPQRQARTSARKDPRVLK
ncbi:putative uncharacterized protein C18orf65 [Sapajus apella]|uniref:Uncharacterized protein n=1 Tax=Sapajus apella TaxID=9515 RepID=A0A6J3J470_SAPAP|nr:putative uncharacterized protein C18orf65 [Sapajus apella]